jgi:hypothetical protein
VSSVVNAFGFSPRNDSRAVLIEDALQFCGNVLRIPMFDVAALNHMYELSFPKNCD